MKKLIALLLALVMVFALVACASKTETPAEPAEETPAAPAEETPAEPAEEPAEEPAAEGNKLIAGIVFQEDQFMKTLAAGYQAAADERGYEILQSNTTNDQTKETEVLMTYLSQGVAGVAISPLNTQTSPATISDVMADGMQVAICNSGIDSFPGAVASFSADNFSFCHQTGENAVKFIQENYDADYTLKVAVVQFKSQIPEQSADRVNGFFAALDEAGIKYEIVADQDAWLQDMAVETTGDILSANPDIDIVFAANDGGTVGSVMAVENAGLQGQTYVFGTDGSEQIVDLLKADNNILQAVTAQDAFQIGYKTVMALIDTLEGNTVEGAGQNNIIPGTPLVRGDDATLDAFLADMANIK